MHNSSALSLSVLAMLGAMLASVSGDALSQSYPSKPIRFIVGYTAGGWGDIAARLVGQKLSENMGQQVIVDNRPGGSGSIGAEMVAKAAPDGYTIYEATIGTHGINPGLFSKLTYDPVNDFAPVSLMAGSPNIVVVNPSVPARSIRELIALAKSKPGQLNYGSSGSGSSTHLSVELFKSMAGVNIVHVPYKGGSQFVIGLLGGQVQVVFDNIPSSLPYVKEGKMRALAVTGAKRSPVLPDLPTVAEAGLPGFEVWPWVGIVAPARTPREIVVKLSHEVNKALNAREVKERLFSLGAEPAGNTPEQFSAFMKAEIAKWAKVVKESGASVD